MTWVRTPSFSESGHPSASTRNTDQDHLRRHIGEFNDILKSAVRESEHNSISDLAKRSHVIAMAVITDSGAPEPWLGCVPDG